MSFTVYGDVFEAGELYDTSKPVLVKSLTRSMIRLIRIPVIVFGEPVLLGLRAKIYGNNPNDDTPSVLLRTSTNSYDKADIVSVGKYGFSDLYFEFDGLQVSENMEFNVVLNADTYTPSGNEVIAWRNGWPDPSYTTNNTPTGNNYLSFPGRISIHGETL